LKVFISSVTHLLKDERNALPPFLRLFDHQPLRFEDFQSQDRSSREACLAGVEAADIYVLLLGPKYGTPWPDTGLAPTAEEFRRARNRGIPILVFDKVVDEPTESAQRAFKDEVGHYVNGRLWRTFTDPLSLNQAVGEALKALPSPGGPLELHPLPGPQPATWLDLAASTSGQVTAPVLELHLIPVGVSTLTSAITLRETARTLARDARSAGFVGDTDPLSTGSDNDTAWVVRPPHQEGGWQRITTDAFRGLSVTATGEAAAYLCLRTDTYGALVDQASLQRDLAQLLALVSPLVVSADGVAPAVKLGAAERVWEGEPADVGSRSSASMRPTTGLTVALESSFYVHASELTRAIGDLASELATRLLNDVRAIRAF
jgi:Domain of unknown function (DUF4062)